MSVRLFTSTREQWVSKLLPKTEQFNAVWNRDPPNQLTVGNMQPMKLASLSHDVMRTKLLATHAK